MQSYVGSGLFGEESRQSCALWEISNCSDRASWLFFFNWPFNIYSVPIPVTDNTLSLHVDHIIFVLLFFVQYIFSAVRVQVFCLLKISIPDSSAWTKSFVFDISGNTWFSVICAFWSRQHHICAENRFPTSQSPTIPFFSCAYGSFWYIYFVNVCTYELKFKISIIL